MVQSSRVLDGTHSWLAHGGSKEGTEVLQRVLHWRLPRTCLSLRASQGCDVNIGRRMLVLFLCVYMDSAGGFDDTGLYVGLLESPNVH